MKICHVTTVHPPDDVRIFIKECAALAAEGLDVTLVVASAGTGFRANGVEVVKVDVKYYNRVGRIFKATRKLSRMVEELRPDIVHFHDPEFLLCDRILKRRGYKLIYDVHEDLPRQIISKGWIPGWLRKPLAAIAERFENRRAVMVDYVITATPVIAQRFRIVNPNTIDVRNYPIPEEFLTKHTKKTDPPSICYIGGITGIRGAFEMIRALENLDVNLELAGPPESDELMASLRELPGWGKTTFHGIVNRKQLAEITGTSSVGLALMHPVPNYLEAFPTKLFEYMLAGLPVVYSHFPLWRRMVEPYDCGIAVDPENISDIAEAISRIISDSDMAEKMGDNARKAALENYNWNNEKEKLLKVYRSLEHLPEEKK